MNYSPKQADVLLNANARWNILHGAVRSGKTFITSDLLAKRVKEQPPGPALIIGKTERTIQRNVLDPMRERFGERYVTRIYGSGECDIFGRKFYVAGANDERSVTKIQGLGLSYAYGDEVTTWPQSFFEMLKSRLDKKDSRFDGTANPEGPYHWLKTDVIDQEEKMNLKHWRFTLDDGASFLAPEFIEALKAEYTGVWYQRYVLGLWVMAEGIIYDMFTEDKCVIDKLDLDPEKVRYGVSIDYGTSNPCVFGLYAVQGKQVRKVKECHYDSRKMGRQKTDPEYSKDLAGFIDGYDVKVIYLDPSATSFRVQLMQDGFHQVRKAKNAVLPGIKTVSKKLADGSYKILRCCRETIKEKATYVWDQNAQNKGEDKPLKENDHCVTGDTKVVTTQGEVAIKDLCGEEGEVICYDTEQQRPAAATFYYVRMTRKDAEIIEIQTEDGRTIRLTDDHLVYTKEGWKKAGQLSPEDYILECS